MEKPPDSHENVDLNPFAFPSETDIRFLLLVLAIAGSTMILTQAVVGIFTKSAFIAVSCALVVTIGLFIIARNQARQSAVKTIRANRWQSFPPKGADPSLSASHQRMDRYIQQTVNRVPELASEKIQFIWDETSKASKLPTGMAFGFGKHQYVCLRQGLHDAFIQFPKSPTFQSVLMHELGHIANRDVSKTIFTTSLGRCFFPFAILSVIVFTFYTLWAVGDRLQRGLSLDPAQPGIQEIINTNIKLILLLLIVEIARSSILRVREYYADARARNWLGNSTDLTQLLSEHLGKTSQKSSKLKNKNKRYVLSIWESFKLWFRNRISPLHPTDRQRIMRLETSRNFFSPSYEVALLAGLLSGVSLNANMSIFNFLSEISNFTGRLNQNVQMADEPTFLVLMTALLFFALAIVFFAISSRAIALNLYQGYLTE
jgi:Zn-dependent protease with chaperone function